MNLRTINIALIIVTVVVLVGLVLVPVGRAAELFQPIVLRIPDGANALVCQPATLGQEP